MHVCHAIFYKASFTLSRCTPRCVHVICSRRTGANRNELLKEVECRHTFPAALRNRSGLGQNVITVCPDYATVYGSSLPEALRCVPVRPDPPWLCPGHRRQSPGVTIASPGSKTAKPRCGTVAYVNKMSVNV